MKNPLIKKSNFASHLKVRRSSALLAGSFLTSTVLSLSTALATPESTVRYEQRSFYPNPVSGWTTHGTPDFGWRTFEDFTLQSNELITTFRWSGYYRDTATDENNPVISNPDLPITDEWGISIHADADGEPDTASLFELPDAEVRIISSRPTTELNQEVEIFLMEFEVTLTTPFPAEAGKTYWISPYSKVAENIPLFVWSKGVRNRTESRNHLDSTGKCWQAPRGIDNDDIAGENLGDLAMVLIGQPANDTDQDGMDDSWETAHGLDPNIDDAQEDPDSDGLVNLGEFEQRSDPQASDTDGDGLSDGVESNRGIYLSAQDTGTSPILADTDRDGLVDSLEVPGTTDSDLHPTDPNLADTDQDDYEDKVEIDNGFDPNDAASNPTPIALGIGGGALLGGDLTDPENDAADNGSFGHNAMIASSDNFDAEAYNAFDNRLNVERQRDRLTARGWPWWSWVSATFDEAIVLTHFTLVSASNDLAPAPRNFEIQGSNYGGLTWDTIFLRNKSSDLFTAAYQVLRFNAGMHYATPPAYRSIRFFGYHHGSPDFRIGELEYFGQSHIMKVTPLSQNEAGLPRIEWTSIPSVTYQLERSTDLNIWTALPGDIDSAGTTTRFTDENLPSPVPKTVFYRVRETE